MSFLRPATAAARQHLLRPFAVPSSRQFSLTATSFTTSQGHATKKAKDPGHKDKDIQSAYVREGEGSKGDAQSSPAGEGENQPLDAARQGNTGGETKSAEGTGAFKDQVGGQGAGGVKKGEKVDASGESYTDMAKNALTGNFGKGAKRSFSTSASRAVEPASDAGAGSREPKHKVEQEGDQSGHLKHKSPEKPDSGKGNAAPEPHLPSQQAAKGQKRGMATKPPGGYSKTFKESGGDNVPPEPLPGTLKSAYAPEATPKPEDGFTPSHESKHSSTSVDPPHQVLTEQAKEGTLADRNPPPEPKMGEMGNKEAWKHRK